MTIQDLLRHASGLVYAIFTANTKVKGLMRLKFEAVYTGEYVKEGPEDAIDVGATAV